MDSKLMKKEWWIHRFLAKESAAATLMIGATLLAIIMKNSSFAAVYNDIIAYPIQLGIGKLSLKKASLLWINDGLMTLYFLVIGLEMKREFLIGKLQEKRKQVLPLASAVGGIIVPAAIYYFFNHNSGHMQGWAIPIATDIAFSLGLLSLLVPNIPTELKVFLTALAIFDDLVAIIVIAIYYTPDLDANFLLLALLSAVALLIANRMNVKNIAIYLVGGFVMWLMVLESGVHATVAGVVLAWLIPITGRGSGRGPALVLEDIMHKWVNIGVLPVFAFANAGVALVGVGAGLWASSIFHGVFWGLFLGKPLGIGLAAWLMLRTGLAQAPRGSNPYSLAGVACLCGVGFTMSLFVGGLAFQVTSADVFVRTGVIAASGLSVMLAAVLFRISARKNRR